MESDNYSVPQSNIGKRLDTQTS